MLSLGIMKPQEQLKKTIILLSPADIGSFSPKLLTPSSGQTKNSQKILNFIFSNPTKQTVPCETTAEEVSFEWLHHRISSTDSKVRTTLYSVINNTTGKYCSVAFI